MQLCVWKHWHSIIFFQSVFFINTLFKSMLKCASFSQGEGSRCWLDARGVSVSTEWFMYSRYSMFLYGSEDWVCAWHRSHPAFGGTQRQNVTAWNLLRTFNSCFMRNQWNCEWVWWWFAFFSYFCRSLLRVKAWHYSVIMKGSCGVLTVEPVAYFSCSILQ